MTCFPIEKKKADRENRSPVLNRMLILIGAVFLVSAVLVGTASAENVNWTEMENLITGVAGIMPEISTLIQSIITPLLILVVVGFLVGLFDSLLSGISRALEFGRR